MPIDRRSLHISCEATCEVSLPNGVGASGVSPASWPNATAAPAATMTAAVPAPAASFAWLILQIPPVSTSVGRIGRRPLNRQRRSCKVIAFFWIRSAPIEHSCLSIGGAANCTPGPCTPGVRLCFPRSSTRTSRSALAPLRAPSGRRGRAHSRTPAVLEAYGRRRGGSRYKRGRARRWVRRSPGTGWDGRGRPGRTRSCAGSRSWQPAAREPRPSGDLARLRRPAARPRAEPRRD